MWLSLWADEIPQTWLLSTTMSPSRLEAIVNGMTLPGSTGVGIVSIEASNTFPTIISGDHSAKRINILCLLLPSESASSDAQIHKLPPRSAVDSRAKLPFCSSVIQSCFVESFNVHKTASFRKSRRSKKMASLPKLSEFLATHASRSGRLSISRSKFWYLVPHRLRMRTRITSLLLRT